MTNDERRLYREALAKARESFDRSTSEMEENKKAQARLEFEIANLRKTITALAAMCSEEPGIDKLGITDSVMSVLQETPYSWSTGEIVNALDAMGFDLSSQKNAAASVHAVLSRLAQRGKITRVPAGDAAKNATGMLEWRGPQYSAQADSELIPF